MKKLEGQILVEDGGFSGIVDTFSIIYTTFGGYVGAVLSPNGDVHFVPHSAAVGQKVNEDGIYSTYSLTYTASQAYYGGVLAQNGDIHFVPKRANRGQRVSVNNVVSTYSLIYTTSDAYKGGVLAPNGDIHFIPTRAPVGQKVATSSSGSLSVSTYSLVYTTTDAYVGGVLAPNGDIHFVPYKATVGQKVDINGIVSTYSLPLPSVEYNTAIVTNDGDIHFIPLTTITANCGTKISVDNVISSYSIPFPSGFSSWSFHGGFVTPDNDILLLAGPSSGLGYLLKISKNFDFSTHPFTRSVSGVDISIGGVLNRLGVYHCAPYYSIGRKITFVDDDVSIAVRTSPFFNKF